MIKQTGFTLVELMVVLAIMGIMAAIASPMGTLYQNSVATSNINEFVASLHFARSHAITSNAPVSVCQMTLTDQQSVPPVCSEGTDWEAGWVVFTDADGNGLINGADTVLRFYEALPTNYTLRSSRGPRIIFSATGMASGFNGTWTLCDPRRSLRIARGASVAVTGRIKLAEDTDGNHIRDTLPSGGADLACPA